MTPAEAMREAAAKVADDQARSDLLIAAKYPDESVKYDNRAHRCKTIAAAIRALPLPAETSESAVAAEQEITELAWHCLRSVRGCATDDQFIEAFDKVCAAIRNRSALAKGGDASETRSIAPESSPGVTAGALAVSDDGEKR